MDTLNSTRTFYTLGNYEAAIVNSVLPDDFELIALNWKAILRASPEGDVSKCAQFWGQSGCTSELLKKALMLWSKVIKSTSSNSNLNYSLNGTGLNSELIAAQEIASKAHESVYIEHDQVILTCAEVALLLNSPETAFKLLKLVKASNLDCQVLFIEILLRLGQVGMAQGRLEKMKNIPEWKDDVRFLLIETQLGLSSDIEPADATATTKFSAKDSLYSYQELIQVHGQTPRLLILLAAAYLLLGKFQEAQNSLLQINSSKKDPILSANFIVLSALLNFSTFPTSLQ